MRKWCALAASLAGFYGLARAQSAGTAALTGTLTDASGGVVSNVTVTTTNASTGQKRSTTSGADGSYRLTLLSPGIYRVSFSAAGFKSSEIDFVTLTVTETAVLDSVLEIGASTEEVTVQGQAQIFDTATAAQGTVLNSRTLASMPLTSRNFSQILGDSAGVSIDVNNGAALGRGSLDFSVNGAAPWQNNFQIDGVSVINMVGTGSIADSGLYAGIPIPHPDALEEVKIQTSTYDASYGRNPGANVNVVTKSGGDVFHGTLFEFFRNTALNANSFFQNRDGGGARQVLNQNQFGGAVGGPVRKDKLFFFGSFQETRQLNGVAANGTTHAFLPPIPEGDRSAPGFPAALGAAMCPANHSQDPRFLTAFAFLGQMQVACDGSNINPIALKLLQVKLPDGRYYIPGSGIANFQPVQFTSAAHFIEHEVIANADYLFSAKNSLAARYLYSHDPQISSLGGTPVGQLPGSTMKNLFANTNSSLKLTSVVTAAFVNEARISMQRNISAGSDQAPYTPQQVGITPIIPKQMQPPVLFVGGAFAIGGFPNAHFSPNTQVQFAEQIAWSRGKHTIRAGFEFEDMRWDLVFGAAERGAVVFPSFADLLIGRAGCTQNDCGAANPGSTNGSPLSNIAVCIACIRSGPDGIVHGYRLHNMSAFFQHDYELSHDLSVNVGVRWEYDGTFTDIYGNLTNVWPDDLARVPVPPRFASTGDGLVGYVVPRNFPAFYGNPPAGVRIVNRESTIQNRIPLSDFAPRFGLAWRPLLMRRLVVRAGAGIFYDRIGGNTFVHSVEQGNPYAVTLDYSGPGATPYSLANLFPSTPLSFVPRYFDPSGGGTSNLNTPFYERVHTPLIRHYSFAVQYALAPKWILELAYVGASGINQTDYGHNYNAALLASPERPINDVTTNTAAAANVNARVPYLGYQPAGLQGTAFDGIYNYNSLQATLRKSISHGLIVQAAYTWSKDLTDLNAAGSANSNDPRNLAQQYGPASFNRPQRLVVAYSWDLPFSSRAGTIGKLFQGWTVSGNTVLQSGIPLTVTDGSGGTVSGIITSGASRAQLCPGFTYSQIANPGSIEARLGGASGGPGYINPAAICRTPVLGSDGASSYGNSGVGILSGPAQSNWDISLSKDTRLRETDVLQFRAEFFNAWNHPQFAGPGLDRNTPNTFGVITGVSTNPRLIQFALKYRF